MCDYCSNGSLRSGKIPIVDMDIDIGMFGKSKFEMFIRHYDTGSYLYAAMDNYGYGGHTVKASQKIMYCPICGASLED